jgi:hypothetical protein
MFRGCIFALYHLLGPAHSLPICDQVHLLTWPSHVSAGRRAAPDCVERVVLLGAQFGSIFAHYLLLSRTLTNESGYSS